MRRVRQVSHFELVKSIIADAGSIHTDELDFVAHRVMRDSEDSPGNGWLQWQIYSGGEVSKPAVDIL